VEKLGVALFRAGLESCGWGKWTAISKVVKTRSPEQVRNFARSRRGQQYRNFFLISGTFKDLAKGISGVVGLLSNMNGKIGTR